MNSEQSFWDCFQICCGNLWSQPLRIFSHLFCFLLNYQEVKLEGKACANIEADLVGVAHDMLLKFKGPVEALAWSVPLRMFASELLPQNSHLSVNV